ncbi:hypothetical protein K435DRAFT_925099 [Dendrothele bispora CBS 962.96]|uniref:Uncharacterized protein n=1 Tax=Dendrothele bispora (strain CBS 962.96) TaxID=1314807 RepID=A0A4S8MHK8_DENBC|nr:hypothetical protein K435DRAFT_925099 [Dendrothele bispora CBS 962.96]
MAYTRSNNPRLDDDARHLTQDYPAFGENLPRASSRSSTVSQASRTTYPGVPEDVLERVSQAKTARLAARARYEAALANPDFPNSVITKLEDDLSKCEDELKFARIERTRAKFSSQHSASSRPLLPAPLPAPAPPQYPPKSLLQPVTEDLDLFLERGEELEKLDHKVNVEGGCENGRASTTNQIDLARTECDSAQLLDQRAATLPGRSLHPSIPVSRLLQIATRFSSQLRNVPFLEQREDPSNRCHRDDAKTGLEDQRLQITDERNLTRTERDHAKPLDRHATAAPRGSVLPTILTSFPQPLAFEDSAPSLLEQGGKLEEPAPFLEWGEEPRRRILNQGAGSKMGEEVGIAGGREERTRSVHDGRVQLPGHYEHEVGFDQETSLRRSDILLEVLEGEEILKGAPTMSRVSRTMEMEVGVDRRAGGMMTRVIWITMTKDEVMIANREEVGMGKTGIMNHVVVHVGEDHREVTLRMMGNQKVVKTGHFCFYSSKTSLNSTEGGPYERN